MDMSKDHNLSERYDLYSHDLFGEDRLTQLQRKMAVNHWRGLESDANSLLQEYHQLVNSLYFNQRSLE